MRKEITINMPNHDRWAFVFFNLDNCVILLEQIFLGIFQKFFNWFKLRSSRIAVCLFICVEWFFLRNNFKKCWSERIACHLKKCSVGRSCYFLKMDTFAKITVNLMKKNPSSSGHVLSFWTKFCLEISVNF